MKSYLKDNRGVTLVELMVAVVVFAIITIPLLNSFKTATLTVVKSEKLGSVSMVAQNVMESVETAKVEDLVGNANTAKTALSAENATYYEKSGGGYAPRTNSGSMPYCIWLEGVSSGERKYNAMVEIMPDSTINDEELSISTPMRVVYSQPTDDENPDEKIKDHAGITDSETDINEIITRDIVIDVTKDGTMLNAEIIYEYEYGVKEEDDSDESESGDEGDEGDEGDGDEGSGEGDGDDEGTETYRMSRRVILEKEYSEGSLSCEIVDGERPAVYLIYTPLFDIEDNIIIKNEDNVDFDLFIIKREADSTGKPYLCKINQEGGLANIYTNVNEGSGHIVVEYYFDDVVFMGVPDNVNGYLVLKETKERAHNITVKIYSYDQDFNSESVIELEGMTIG